MIYQPRKGWGLVGDVQFACHNEWLCTSDSDPQLVERDYRKWEREYLDWDNNINYLDLQNNPEDYIFPL